MTKRFAAKCTAAQVSDTCLPNRQATGDATYYQLVSK